MFHYILDKKKERINIHFTLCKPLKSIAKIFTQRPQEKHLPLSSGLSTSSSPSSDFMCVFPTKTPKYRLFPLDESLLDGFFPVFLSVIHFNVVSIGGNDSLMASPCSVSLRYKQNRPPRPEDCTLLMLLLSTSFHA